MKKSTFIFLPRSNIFFITLFLGYECRGLENVPDEGPALFVGYHGTLPIDIYYLISKCILFKKRTLHVVADKFVFKIPCKLFFLQNSFIVAVVFFRLG